MDPRTFSRTTVACSPLVKADGIRIFCWHFGHLPFAPAFFSEARREALQEGHLNEITVSSLHQNEDGLFRKWSPGESTEECAGLYRRRSGASRLRTWASNLPRPSKVKPRSGANGSFVGT